LEDETSTKHNDCVGEIASFIAIIVFRERHSVNKAFSERRDIWLLWFVWNSRIGKPVTSYGVFILYYVMRH